MNKLKKFFQEKIEPGIITGVSDDDLSGIVAYSVVGTKSGLDFIWAPLFTLPLMYCVQEACARIALVTRKGLIYLIKRFYGIKITIATALLMFFTNTFNLAADINALAMIINYFFTYVYIDLLFYTSVIYSFLSPSLIFFILKLSNNKELMGKYKNSYLNNFVLSTTFLIIIISVIFFIFFK